MFIGRRALTHHFIPNFSNFRVLLSYLLFLTFFSAASLSNLHIFFAASTFCAQSITVIFRIQERAFDEVITINTKWRRISEPPSRRVNSKKYLYVFNSNYLL